MSRATDPVGTATVVANQVPEAVLVLACALFAAGAGRGGLLAGMLAAVVELSRQVPTWLAIDLGRPGLSGEGAIYISAAVVQSAGAAAAILLFRRALGGLPAPPATAAGRGRALRLAWLAIGVQAAACIGVVLLTLAVRLLEILGPLQRAQERGLAAFPGSPLGTLLTEAGLTLAPLLVASLVGLRRPTQLAIGLAFVAQAAWGVLLLAVAVAALVENRQPLLAVAAALLPPLGVAVLLLGVRPAPADNLSL